MCKKKLTSNIRWSKWYKREKQEERKSQYYNILFQKVTILRIKTNFRSPINSINLFKVNTNVNLFASSVMCFWARVCMQACLFAAVSLSFENTYVRYNWIRECLHALVSMYVFVRPMYWEILRLFIFFNFFLTLYSEFKIKWIYNLLNTKHQRYDSCGRRIYFHSCIAVVSE